jgi:hypothetical protein
MTPLLDPRFNPDPLPTALAAPGYAQYVQV